MQTFVHLHEQPHIPNATNKKLATGFPGWKTSFHLSTWEHRLCELIPAWKTNNQECP